MADNICQISKEAIEKVKKFRMRKGTDIAAILLKINKDTMTIEVEEEVEDSSVDDIRDLLPERQPRYLVMSYRLEHGDGRVSYPLCFVNSMPTGCSTTQNMMYAGSKLKLLQETKIPHVFDIDDVEELDEDWLQTKLKK